jgi:hypothetical protein
MMARRALAAAGLLLFVATRLLAVPEPIGIDQGIFATAGWGLTRGLMLYRDVWDQKPPGIHLIYAAAIAIGGARPAVLVVLDTAAWTAILAITTMIAARLGSRRAAAATAIALAVATFPPFARNYGGFLERAVPETFIAVLAAAAVWSTATRRYLAAGVLVGAAAVFKPTALVYAPACVLAAAALATEATDGHGWTRIANDDWRRAAVRMASTVALPWLAVAAWLWAAGAGADAWVAVVDYNGGYVAAGSGPLVLPIRIAHEVWRLVKSDPGWLVAAAGGLFAMAAGWRGRSWRAVPPIPLAATIWLAAVIVAIAANGVRMYANYFLPAAPPIALLGGWFLAEYGRGRRAIAVAIVLAAAAAVTWRSHAVERAGRYVSADAEILRGTLAREPYLELFGGYGNGRGYSARANAELTDYLRAHAAPGDRLYIFGMAPSVYFTAARLPANRFVWTYPAVAPFLRGPDAGADALARDLSLAAPAWLVLEANNRDSASGWRIEDVYAAPSIRALLDRYERAIVIEDFTVLRRAVQ